MRPVLSATTALMAAVLLFSAVPAQAQRGERSERPALNGPSRGDARADAHGSFRGHDRTHSSRPDMVVVQPVARHGQYQGVPRVTWAGHPRGVTSAGGAYHPRYAHRPWVGGPVLRPISPYYPRYGGVIRHRPALWTWVTVGALAYLYADGVYYRELRNGGYEVVAPPIDSAVAVAEPPAVVPVFVYPREGQSAQQQATDEYDCHRWAVQQTGFDPSSVAAGTAGDPSVEQLSGYPRARDACLNGRGYTVR